MASWDSSATAAVQKKEIRKCACGNRMSNLTYDFQTVCFACRSCECHFDYRSNEFKDVSNDVIKTDL